MPRQQPEQFRAAEGQATIRPAHLYVIEHRGELIHLCDHDVPITVEGLPEEKGADPQVFTPAQIDHSGQEQSTSELGNNQVQVRLGINDSEFAGELRQMILFNAPARATVTIARVNSAELPGPVTWGTDTYTLFRGVGTHLAFGGAVMTLSLVSVILNMDGKLPRYFWQKRCQHPLYGPFCGADPTLSRNHLETTIAAVNVRHRYVDIADVILDGSAIQAHTFQGGKLQAFTDDTFAGDPLAVVTVLSTVILPAAAGVRLYLGWWAPELTVGRDLRLLRGCRRILEDCQAIQNNTLNFGGMPHIPDISPSFQGIR